MKENIHRLSLASLSKLIKSREISPVEITQMYLDRIESLEPKLHSYITVLGDNALKEAKKAESEILKGNYRGPLHGIPYSIKDLFFTKGIRTTMGSKLYDSHIPFYNSTIVDKLEQAGAILLGKNNLNIFAFGTTGLNPDYGEARNPWNEQLIPGGSSSGSATAVAAGECAFSIGSDTGGSIRIPASLCGVVGFKPTYGLISKYGAFPHSWSQDNPGPMTRNVMDCAAVLNVIAGYDHNDPSSIHNECADFTPNLTGDISGVKIGLPREMFDLPVSDGVHKAVLQAISKLESMGASIREVSWPMFDKAMAISNTIKMPEVTSYYSKLIREHGSEIFEPVRMRLESGFFVSACDYIQAQRARVLFIRKSLEMMEEVDVLISPATPVTAFKMDTDDAYNCKIGGVTRNVVPLLTQYVLPFNLNGFPAISLICGFSEDGLPLGLQVSGKHREEEKVLQVAYAYEQAAGLNNTGPFG